MAKAPGHSAGTEIAAATGTTQRASRRAPQTMISGRGRQAHPQRNWQRRPGWRRAGIIDKDIDPGDPLAGKQHERHRCDHGRGAERDTQRAPFAPNGEPEEADSRGDLCQHHEPPSGGVPEAQDDRRGDQQVEVAVIEVHGDKGDREERERVATSHEDEGTDQDRVPAGDEDDPRQRGERCEEQRNCRRIREEAEVARRARDRYRRDRAASRRPRRTPSSL